jgi:metal-responsive CopG/Arc/MetJ family transcriptional regulator
MPTSVHIPDKLLQRADKRAKALGISRNRLIVRALERELREGSEWSTGFFELLRARDDETAAAVDEMMSAIKLNRRSKPPTQV